jgi:CRP/FNR family transcriptional regulator, dissimilatory nitrate respiration regulator
MEKELLINKIPLFDGLPPDQIRDLAAITIDKRIPRNSTIFSEGAPATGFYVVISGRVKIYKISPDGKEQILHLFGSGEPFGEVPVFEGRRFPAHATALEDSRLLFFPRVDFIELIKSNPSLALNMLAVLSKRLRRFTVLVDDLSLKEVPARLAAHFLALSNQKGGATDVELEVPKSQLAGMLGTIPETFSRILGRMIKGGFIDSEGAKIRIKDREGLSEIAQGIRRL